MSTPRRARIRGSIEPSLKVRARVRANALEIEDAHDLALVGPLNLASGSDLAQLVRRAIALVDAGQLAEAHELLKPSLDKDGGLGPAGARAALLLEGARILVRLGRHDEAMAKARRGLSLAEVDGDSRLAAEALNRLGLTQLRRGDLKAARVSYEEARSRFRRLGDEARVAAMENNLGLVCKGLGEWDAARSHLAESIAVTRRHPALEALGYRLKNLGVLETKSGRWARARDLLDEAASRLAKSEDPRHRAKIALALGHLARLDGRAEEARELLAAGLAHALAQGQPREEAVAREFLGDLALDRGAPREAWQAYRAALEVAERLAPALDLECEILHRLARAQLALDDRAGAEASLDRAAAAARALADPYELARVDVVRAELAAANGRPDTARVEYARAVHTLTELGERHERGRALAAWAALATNAIEARRLLVRAAACFEETGAERERVAIEARLFHGAPAPLAAPGTTADRGPDRFAIAGNSRPTVAARSAVQRAARCALPVLVVGEAGAGARYVAHAVHERSTRSAGPLVVVRCALLSPERALVELVGDARGTTLVPGRIGEAEGGTLLLEDVSTLTPAAQAVLLRLVTARTYMSPGELAPRAADVRVIAIQRPESNGSGLRADLAAALGAITIALPPLAARAADVAPLARAFLRLYGGPSAPRLLEGAEKALLAHAWPGHVRELELVIQTALLQAPAGTKALDGLAVSTALKVRAQGHEAGPAPVGAGDPDAPAVARPGADGASPAPATAVGLAPGAEETAALRARLAAVEREELLAAIDRARGNKSRAARILRVSRKTLYARMHRHGLAVDGEPAPGPIPPDA